MGVNVLIVDDDESKATALSNFLKECNLDVGLVVWVADAASARRSLQERYYDLMLLDVLLPSRSGGRPAGDVSVDFLREIMEDETSPSPGRIVAVTAEANAIAGYESDFRRMVTQIIHVELGNDEWKHSIKCLIAHINAGAQARNQFDYDLCIQATLRVPELAQVLAIQGIKWLPEEMLSHGLLYRQGTWVVGKRTFKVACAHATQMGMVAASHLASCLISKLRPRILLMTGICGSVGEADVGDLVVADKSWDWQAGKWGDQGDLQIAPDQKDASSNLISLARGLDDIVSNISKGFEGGKPANNPRIHVAPIASGSSVVADKEFHSLFKKQHRKVEGIDMECYGFYHAAALADEPKPEYLCLKAVSDRADRQKSDNFQGYCSYLSAKAALHVAEKRLSVLTG